MFFTFRFHLPEEKVMEWIHDSGSKNWFVVRETDAARPHFQGIIENNKEHQAIKKQIQRTLDVHGNKDYSIKKCKESIENLMTYYCKGADEDTLPEVIADTFVYNTEERHKNYWIKNRELKAISKKSVLQEMVEWLQQNPAATIPMLRDQGARFIIRRNQKIIPHNLRSWVITAWMKTYDIYPEDVRV